MNMYIYMYNYILYIHTLYTTQICFESWSGLWLSPEATVNPPKGQASSFGLVLGPLNACQCQPFGFSPRRLLQRCDFQGSLGNYPKI